MKQKAIRYAIALIVFYGVIAWRAYVAFGAWDAVAIMLALWIVMPERRP